jgi:enoyl-CoA hydratase
MIELTQHASVATLHIQRAAKKNALTHALWLSLHQHVQTIAKSLAQSLSESSAARVLLLQGEPGAFCAGADIEELAQLVQDPALMQANQQVIAQTQLALQALPLPTIAVIDGACFGGGFGLAAACDFRLGSTRSRFAVTPARLGLLYSLEDTQRLVRVLGDAKARRLLMRGETLDATTALQWGALDAVVEPDALPQLAAQWAQELAAQSRTSMAGIKATLAACGSALDDTGAVRAAFTAAFTGADFAEGAAAFLARRAPQFR